MLLSLQNLHTEFTLRDGVIHAVNDVSFYLQPGEVVGIVGESGSGKSQLLLSAFGLLARNGRVVGGSAFFKGQNLLTLSPAQLNTIRGRQVGFVFQDPLTALNPYRTLEDQMVEGLYHHLSLPPKQARARVLEMLDKMGISDPMRRLQMYPHQLSGGMRQRVLIAMALLCQPDILIADEPTTALDVTIQAQILSLLRTLKQSLKTAMVIISHDLGVIAHLCDRVCVMYAGRIVEQGSLAQILRQPLHPYTQGLLRCASSLDQPPGQPLPTIPGHPPDLQYVATACPFYERCDRHGPECLKAVPPLAPKTDVTHAVACYKA